MRIAIGFAAALGITATILIGCTSVPARTSGSVQPERQSKQGQSHLVAHVFVKFVSLDGMNIQVNRAGTDETYQFTDKTTFIDKSQSPMSLEQFKNSAKAGDELVISADFASKIALTVRLGGGLPIRFGN
jgi:hypothetical protein